jgi:hypothetical protein
MEIKKKLEETDEELLELVFELNSTKSFFLQTPDDKFIL